MSYWWRIFCCLFMNEMISFKLCNDTTRWKYILRSCFFLLISLFSYFELPILVSHSHAHTSFLFFTFINTHILWYSFFFCLTSSFFIFISSYFLLSFLISYSIFHGFRLISDTSIYLLGATLVASLLHLLFEFLAFQSDVAFWNQNKVWNLS